MKSKTTTKTAKAKVAKARQKKRKNKSPQFLPDVLTSGNNIQTFYDWLDEHFVPDPKRGIPRNYMYSLFIKYCAKHKLVEECTEIFGKLVKYKFPNVIKRRLGSRTDMKYYYWGLGAQKKSSHYKTTLAASCDNPRTAVPSKKINSKYSQKDIKSVQTRSKPDNRDHSVSGNVNITMNTASHMVCKSESTSLCKSDKLTVTMPQRGTKPQHSKRKSLGVGREAILSESTTPATNKKCESTKKSGRRKSERASLTTQLEYDSLKSRTNPCKSAKKANTSLESDVSDTEHPPNVSKSKPENCDNELSKTSRQETVTHLKQNKRKSKNTDFTRKGITDIGTKTCDERQSVRIEIVSAKRRASSGETGPRSKRIRRLSNEIIKSTRIVKRETRQGKGESRETKGETRQSKGESRQGKGESRQTKGESRQGKGESRQAKGESRQGKSESNDLCKRVELNRNTDNSQLDVKCEKTCQKQGTPRSNPQNNPSKLESDDPGNFAQLNVADRDSEPKHAVQKLAKYKMVKRSSSNTFLRMRDCNVGNSSSNFLTRAQDIYSTILHKNDSNIDVSDEFADDTTPNTLSDQIVSGNIPEAEGIRAASLAESTSLTENTTPADVTEQAAEELFGRGKRLVPLRDPGYSAQRRKAANCCCGDCCPTVRNAKRRKSKVRRMCEILASPSMRTSLHMAIQNSSIEEKLVKKKKFVFHKVSDVVRDVDKLTGPDKDVATTTCDKLKRKPVVVLEMPPQEPQLVGREKHSSISQNDRISTVLDNFERRKVSPTVKTEVVNQDVQDNLPQQKGDPNTLSNSVIKSEMAAMLDRATEPCSEGSIIRTLLESSKHITKRLPSVISKEQGNIDVDCVECGQTRETATPKRKSKVWRMSDVMTSPKLRSSLDQAMQITVDENRNQTKAKKNKFVPPHSKLAVNMPQITSEKQESGSSVDSPQKSSQVTDNKLKICSSVGSTQNVSSDPLLAKDCVSTTDVSKTFVSTPSVVKTNEQVKSVLHQHLSGVNGPCSNTVYTQSLNSHKHQHRKREKSDRINKKHRVYTDGQNNLDMANFDGKNHKEMANFDGHNHQKMANFDDQNHQPMANTDGLHIQQGACTVDMVNSYCQLGLSADGPNKQQNTETTFPNHKQVTIFDNHNHQALTNFDNPGKTQENFSGNPSFKPQVGLACSSPMPMTEKVKSAQPNNNNILSDSEDLNVSAITIAQSAEETSDSMFGIFDNHSISECLDEFYCSSSSELDTPECNAASPRRETLVLHMDTSEEVPPSGMDVQQVAAPSGLDVQQVAAPSGMDVQQVAAPSGLDVQQVAAPTNLDVQQVATPSGMDVRQVAAPSGMDVLQVAAPSGLDVQQVAAPTNLDVQQVAAPSGMDVRQVAAPSGMDVQQAAAPSGMNVQQVAAPSGLDVQQVAAPSGLDAQQVAAQSFMDAQQVAPPSLMDAQQMAAPPGLDVQQVAAPSGLDVQQVAAPSGLDVQQVSAASGVDAQEVAAQSGVDAQQVAAQSLMDAQQVAPPSLMDAQQMAASSGLDVQQGAPQIELNSKQDVEKPSNMTTLRGETTELGSDQWDTEAGSEEWSPDGVRLSESNKVWRYLPPVLKNIHREEVHKWLEEEFEWSPPSCLPRQSVYDLYDEFCKQNLSCTAPPAILGKMMQEKFKLLAMRRLGGRKCSKYYYMGLDIRPESSAYSSLVKQRIMTAPKPKRSSVVFNDDFKLK